MRVLVCITDIFPFLLLILFSESPNSSLVHSLGTQLSPLGEQNTHTFCYIYMFLTTGLSDEERVNFVRPKKIVILKKRKKTTQKIETVKYKVLFDHVFSDRNYSKVYKFRRYTISPSFFYYLLLIFRISIVHWLNCRNLKDELNRSYNGGVVVYLLQSELSMENA